MADSYRGFADLGAAIGGGFGGPDNTSASYLGGMREGYKVQQAGFARDKTREEARRARSIAIAREALPEAAATLYGDRAGPLAAAILGGNTTADLDQLGDLAVPGSLEAYDAAAAALRGGNVPAYNDELAIATNKPREPYELAAGGKATFRPDTGDVALTDLGAAALDSERALQLGPEATAAASLGRERANDATAEAQRALAEQRRRAGTGQTTPRPPRAAGTGNPAVSDDTPPVPGARKAPDGFWYVADPSRPGKWLRVDADA